MEKEITYYSLADNDFNFLKFAVDNKQISNAMASLAQNICERYLKHIISIYCPSCPTDLMKTHSLIRLLKYLKQNLTDFQIDYDLVQMANGYYFDTSYPGDNAFFVDESDIEKCWNAVYETKRAVDLYLSTHQVHDISLNKISFFDS